MRKTSNNQSDSTHGYKGTKFGTPDSMGLGVYRDNSVCFGEAPSRLESLLFERNFTGYRSNFEKVKIDIGSMLIFAIGNPMHLGLNIRGSLDHIEVGISCKESPVSRMFIYRDPSRNCAYFNPEVSSEYLGLDLGVINCILGARIASLLWTIDVQNNVHQTSPASLKVWEFLADNHIAAKIGEKTFALKKEFAQSHIAAEVLEAMLKVELNSDIMHETVQYREKAVSPSELNRIDSANRRTIDYWFQGNSKE